MLSEADAMEGSEERVVRTCVGPEGSAVRRRRVSIVGGGELMMRQQICELLDGTSKNNAM